MFRADALSVCRALLPTWSGVLDARLEPITGGITNTLRKVVPSVFFEKENEKRHERTRAQNIRPCRVFRVFGRGTEAFLDRDTENAALAELNACGFGARCLGVFKNGRLEAFLADARPAAPAEMADASVSRAADAAALRRFHACARARAFRGSPTREHLPKTIADLGHHAFVARGGDERRGGDARSASRGSRPGWNGARRRRARSSDGARRGRADGVAAQRRARRERHAPRGYRPGSRELGHEPPTVTLIDFEYSCYGPRGFDLANHLIEHAGFECDWRALPSRAFRRDFCAAYLGDEAANEAAVTKLRLETEAFYPVSHLWWGLWAAMQARTSTIDFDYAGHAAKRLAEFRRS